MDPPTESEIAEYGNWLGLDAEDSDLVWIAKQALQTAIPAPWVECQTEEGDVFYYNAKTKESVWDHPYDSYYKTVIGKYKSGKCSKEELVNLVSQDWLLDGDDYRSSSKDDPSQIEKGRSGTSPSSRRRNRGFLDVSPESPKITVKLSNESLSIITGSDLLHVPSGSGSPIRNRRRSGSAPDIYKPPNRRHRGNGDNISSSQEEVATSVLGEIENLKETLKVNSAELSVAKLKVEQLTNEMKAIEASNNARIHVLTTDLIKAREYIELLLVDIKTLRTRMAEALTRVQTIHKESLSVKDQLKIESNRREIAESRVLDLEEQLLSMEAPGSSSRRHIFGRLCGTTTLASSSKLKFPVTSISRSAPATPGLNPSSIDPYKELIGLLAASSNVPPTRELSPPTQSAARI